MKKLAVCILLTLCTITGYTFSLDFTDLNTGERIVNYNDSEWTESGRTSTYKVLVDKEAANRDKKSKVAEFHSVTVFNDPQEYQNFPYQIKAIYTYGLVNCDLSQVMVLSDIFVDLNSIVRFAKSYEKGKYVVDMENTKIQKEILASLCGENV